MRLEDFKGMLKGLLSAFSDLRFIIEDQVIARDKYTTHWIAEGTHTGSLGDRYSTNWKSNVGSMV
jgi:hypothetical protein